MKHVVRSVLCLVVLCTSGLAEVRYSLTVLPQAQSIQVSMTLEAGVNQAFRIPAWCPGFYFLQDYHNNVSDVRATNEKGEAVQVEQDSSDPRKWTARNASQETLTLSYRVLGDDSGLGFFGVNVRSDTAFVNGPAAFLYAEGTKEEPCTLKITTPEGWELATGLDAESGVLKAKNYDELLDSPLQLGKMARRSFTVEGLPFQVVFASTNGRYPSNLSAVVQELQQLSAPAIKLFGGAPFKRYVYIVHLAVGNFNGGLEHRASTVIATNNSGSLQLGTLAAHEFFHAWNVKQIRPQDLGPFDYTNKVRTGNLWFAEGVTDYYAYLTAYRSGRYDSNWLLNSLSGQIREYQSGSTRKRLTLEQCCRETWENGGFGVDDFDYYNKGLLAGLLFDAAIRGATEGKRSLDDVMRLLYSRHKLPNPGYPEDGILKAINEVAGTDLSALYRRIVQSTEELPYEVLEQIGLRVPMPGTSGVSASNAYWLIVDSAATAESKERLEQFLKR